MPWQQEHAFPPKHQERQPAPVESSFPVNVFSMLYLTKAALSHLKERSSSRAASDPSYHQLPFRKSVRVRRGYSARAGRTDGRDRSIFPAPGLQGRLIHDRPGAASKRGAIISG